MLAEAISWLLTPATLQARLNGRLAESVAIMARERRCREAWRPHLEASRAALLDSARSSPSRRIAVLFGSGPLLDVPLDELAPLFEAVWLVDVVHPWRARLRARRHANVRLITQDVVDRPARFLDDDRIDWIASVNLLSQLPDERSMSEHLHYLARFHGRVCLLADLEHVILDADGKIVERDDFRSLLENWRVAAEWRWQIAPPGELPGGQRRHHAVAALERR